MDDKKCFFSLSLLNKFLTLSFGHFLFPTAHDFFFRVCGLRFCGRLRRDAEAVEASATSSLPPLSPLPPLPPLPPLLRFLSSAVEPPGSL